MESQFIDVCNKGSYFYPAHEHYGRKTSVRCDRCGKTNIVECIGYGDKLDLCLDCVTTINKSRIPKKINDVEPLTFMMQTQFSREEPLTLMMQRQFSQRSSATTIGTDQQFIDVCNKGIYFYPAHEHYGRETSVGCDRCTTSNLVECIGYGDKLDLCLNCVSEINKSRVYDEKEPVMYTRMMQHQFIQQKEPVMYTKMMQHQFVQEKPIVGTMMMQTQFLPRSKLETSMKELQFQDFLEKDTKRIQKELEEPSRINVPTKMTQNQTDKQKSSVKWQGKEMSNGEIEDEPL
uniref:Uncharacterized protein n=1 Tax=viral metagenome TaxID=1070528 RepID=A0A6C0C8N4_9ZZZZ